MSATGAALGPLRPEGDLGNSIQEGVDKLVDVLGDTAKDYINPKHAPPQQVEDKTMKHIAIALVVGGIALFAWKRWGKR